MFKEVITWFSIVSPLVPLVFLFVYRNRQPKQNLILGISLLMSLTFDLIGAVLAHNRIRTIPVINVYFLLAFPAIMMFYHEILVKRSLKITIRVFTIFFFAFALFSVVDQGIQTANNTTWTLSSILVTIASFFFVGDLNLMDETNFSRNPYHKTNIILNTSLAFYYLVTIAIFAATDYVFSHLTSEDILLFWSFHNAAHVLKNVGLTVAFYLTAKRSLALANVQNQSLRDPSLRR